MVIGVPVGPLNGVTYKITGVATTENNSPIKEHQKKHLQSQ